MEHKIYKSIVEDTNTKGEVIIAINAIGNVDKQGDRSMPGSFNKTISEGLGNIYWYKNHDDNEVLGVPLKLWEQDPYINAHAKFNLEKEFSRNMYSDYKFFQANNLTIKHSVGVTAINFKMNGNIRDVTEWKLWEFSSLTKWPANDDTPALAVKNLDNLDYANVIENIELYLKWIQTKGLHTDNFIRKFEQFEQLIKSIIQDRPLNAPIQNEPLNVLIDGSHEQIKAPDRGQPNELNAKNTLDLDYLINNIKI